MLDNKLSYAGVDAVLGKLEKALTGGDLSMLRVTICFRPIATGAIW